MSLPDFIWVIDKLTVHVLCLILIQTVAMKFILKHGKTDKDLHNLRQEIEILRKLKHENIIEMIDTFETPQEFCVVTEFAQVHMNLV